MRRERGQASILIAVIFQILFVFFAMIINVGLLVHDKINLQNSVDIAAYYGAMKQAEILNAMAQVNYQIRQSWKLFNWRLWVLADAGRNENFLGATPPTSDGPATWKEASNHYPVVCVANKNWDEYQKRTDNYCYDSQISITDLNPIPYFGMQSVISTILQPYQQFIQHQSDIFHEQLKNTGNMDYQLAARFIASYKLAAAHRRFVMHKLQNLFLNSHCPSGDFKDLSGSCVGQTVKLTLENNLSSANQNGLQFEFKNGLTKPFLVPEEVRAIVAYEDFVSQGAQKGVVKTMNQLPVNSIATDTSWVEPFYFSDLLLSSYSFGADQFLQESEDFSNVNAFYSLVGFEKNPWVLAYVSVQASTTPKMLFSPVIGTPVTLKAESYAMPFGGKIGPWFYTIWNPHDGNSSGQGKLNQIDQNLPPRMDYSSSGPNQQPVSYIPNYSRYPGDKWGMSSRVARYVGFSQWGLPNLPSLSDYVNIAQEQMDPIVSVSATGHATPPLRSPEVMGVAPDVFDATYYSVDYDFRDHLGGNANNFYQNMCSEQASGIAIGCLELGSNFVANKYSTYKDLYAPGSTTVVAKSGTYNLATWILSDIAHLNSSWSQGDPGQYSDTNLIGHSWEQHPDDYTPAGGRAGYSVKIVSKAYLLRSDLPFGGGGSGASITGPISNPPQ